MLKMKVSIRKSSKTTIEQSIEGVKEDEVLI